METERLKVGETRYEIELYHCEESESPRDWDNLSRIVMMPLSEYELAGKNDIVLGENWHSSDAQEAEEQAFGVELPLIMLDHGGISLSTNREWPYNCQWDAGQIGVIGITAEDMAKNKISEEQARVIIEGEISAFNQYLAGEVYGYDLTKLSPYGENDELIDSLGGIYPSDNQTPMEAAKETIDIELL